MSGLRHARPVQPEPIDARAAQANHAADPAQRARLAGAIGSLVAGRMDDGDFLGRIYNLSELGSTDYRFSDAASDIWQHRTNNYDWDDDWVFSDPRFNLREGSDENLVRFLAETVHPVVRRDQTEADTLVRAYNDTLRPDGFEIVETSRMGDRIVYGWRRIAAVRAPAASALRDHPDLADKAVLIKHLDRIQRDLNSDPSAAISSSKNLLETLCKIVLIDSDVDYAPSEDLPGLFAKVAAELSINADSVPHDARASDSIRKLMRTLTTTVQAVAETRNSTLGDGHGGEHESPSEPRHARLVYNATTAVAEFIVETWTACAIRVRESGGRVPTFRHQNQRRLVRDCDGPRQR